MGNVFDKLLNVGLVCSSAKTPNSHFKGLLRVSRYPGYRTGWLSLVYRDTLNLSSPVDMAMVQNQWCHFGLGASPILVYFSGDWDVHWEYRVLTHMTRRSAGTDS